MTMCEVQPGAQHDVRGPGEDAKLPSIGEIRAAVPKWCFQHATSKALVLLLRGVGIVMGLFLLVTLVARTPGRAAEPLAAWEWAVWGLYGFCQGSAATGLWVLAHECGHGGFSASKPLNDTVGYVLHSLLLVPYFSWQYSHGKHHAKNNHLIDGETHVPETRETVRSMGLEAFHSVFGDDCFAVVEVILHLFFGWPVYLLTNVTGGRRLRGQMLEKPVPLKLGLADHFRPSSPLFPAEWQGRVALSTLGVVFTLGLLALATARAGLAAVVVHYWMPYLWVNFWLVLYTWLQHTDPEIPHYGDEDWTWLKGALATVDRPYGLFDWLHHHIGSTHVCHHLFSSLPCYHAVAATESLRAFLEPRGLYNYDPTPWPLALWRVGKTCHFVEGISGTQFYKSFGHKGGR